QFMDNSQSQSLDGNKLENWIQTGTASFEAGNYMEAGKDLTEACEIAYHLQRKKEQALSLLLLAKVRRAEGQYEAAHSSLKTALELRTQLFGEKSLETAEILDELGCTDFDAGKLEEGKDHFSRALEIRQSTQPQNELDLASSYCNFGLLLMRLDRT